jgi:signal transduction histidine kinase
MLDVVDLHGENDASKAIDAGGAAPVSVAERARFDRYNRERSLRLSSLVALAFGGLTALALLGVGLYVWLDPRVVTQGLGVMVGTLLACEALYIVGVSLAHQRQAFLAAATITGSMLLSISIFQVIWSSARGPDALLVATFGADAIVIGLAGVLGNARYMFACTALINGLSALTLLVLPPLVRTSPFRFGDVVTLLIVIAVHWTIAVLIFGASVLYDQALHELGDVRLAFERAQQLDALKDQFITSVNHELRTPAMTMQGYLELLRLRQNELAPERRAAMIERACRAGDDLVSLLTSILDIQRMDQEMQTFVPEAVDLREAIETAARMIDPREGHMVERELRLAIPQGLEVRGEPVRVQQILTNLLSNAVKYSPPGSPVEMAAHLLGEVKDSAARQRAKRPVQHFVEITVRDFGLGIPPDQIPLLFNRFVRLPRDLASSVVGNGLGLHLCRTLAQVMGGTIWVESAGIEGQGSTFHLRLPTAPHGPGAPQVSITPAVRVNPATPDETPASHRASTDQAMVTNRRLASERLDHQKEIVHANARPIPTADSHPTADHTEPERDEDLDGRS